MDRLHHDGLADGPLRSEAIRPAQPPRPPPGPWPHRAWMPATEVTHLVTVSCTGFASAGVRPRPVRGPGAPTRCVQRTHVGFMGCHGALNGLRVANGICASADRLGLRAGLRRRADLASISATSPTLGSPWSTRCSRTARRPWWGVPIRHRADGRDGPGGLGGQRLVPWCPDTVGRDELEDRRQWLRDDPLAQGRRTHRREPPAPGSTAGWIRRGLRSSPTSPPGRSIPGALKILDAVESALGLPRIGHRAESREVLAEPAATCRRPPCGSCSTGSVDRLPRSPARRSPSAPAWRSRRPSSSDPRTRRCSAIAGDDRCGLVDGRVRSETWIRPSLIDHRLSQSDNISRRVNESSIPPMNDRQGSSFEVAIAGAGLAGASLALRLAARGGERRAAGPLELPPRQGLRRVPQPRMLGCPPADGALRRGGPVGLPRDPTGPDLDARRPGGRGRRRPAPTACPGSA